MSNNVKAGTKKNTTYFFQYDFTDRFFKDDRLGVTLFTEN
jgi:hypothetical protein